MAGSKKQIPARSSGGSGSPNTAVVVFLVLFVLVSIGLGVWGYYGYAGQESLKKQAIDKGKEAERNSRKSQFYEFVSIDLLQAFGQPLDENELKDLQLGRKDFLKENSKWKDEIKYEEYSKTMQELRAKLDFKNEAYSKTFESRDKETADELARAKAELATKTQELQVAKKQFDVLNNNADAFYKKADEGIAKGAMEAKKAAEAKNDFFDKLIEQNNQLTKKNQAANDEFKEEKQTLENAIRELKGKLVAAMDKKSVAPEAGGAAAPGGMPHPLVLDISKGRPLWDRPRGRVIKVLPNRQVVINLGTDDRLSKEVTFMVFAPKGKDGPTDKEKDNLGEADKELKGSIEVVTVVDSKASIAQITMLTNPDKNPIKEGDLLFNVFWGEHVAVAGAVNLTGGVGGESVNEQVRDLDQFLRTLLRQGVIVDAYVDLADGTIKGRIDSNKTRFLIRGQNLYEKAPEKKGPGMPLPPKEKLPPLDKAGDVAPMPEVKKADDDAKVVMSELAHKRIEAVHTSINAVRAEAIEDGLLFISAQNFANISGYRRPRSGAADEASGVFQPTLPSANSPPR